MDKEIITAISTGIALLIGAFLTPFFNFLTGFLSKKEKIEKTEDIYITKDQLNFRLEQHKRDIMYENRTCFASIDTVKAMQNEFNEIKGKLDKIYDILINRGL